MLEVIKPGLETSVQDYPGRIGFWNQGFPPSGPMDSWSFRLANVLVGNEPGAAGLECQFVGPTLKFRRDGVIAVTGADMQPKLDGEPIPMWRASGSRPARRSRSPSPRSARAAMSRSPAASTRRPGSARARPSTRRASAAWTATRSRPARWSRSPRPKAGPAGGSRIPRRPPISTDKRWTIEAVPGPNDDWIDRCGPRALPERRLEAVGQERSHRLPARGPGLDLHREGLQQVA